MSIHDVDAALLGAKLKCRLVLTGDEELPSGSCVAYEQDIVDKFE